VRTLTYLVAASLDGFIAAPDGRTDFFRFDQQYQDHVVGRYPETLPAHVRDALGVTAPGTTFDTVIMGYRTYQVGLDEGYLSPYSHLRQIVVSTRLDGPPHPDVEVVATDPSGFVRRLKGEDGGGIYLCGGGTLAAALVAEIDELVIKTNPVVVGEGIPLFQGAVEPHRFRPTALHTIDSGVTFAHYERALGS
jgi:dihydrofolate reductase